jgi:transcriptional regulator with XRE-family HTH domain
VRDDELVRRFGTLVRRLRLNRGWSQEDYAERCGLHRTFLSSVERGEKVVSLTTANKLALGLGISLGQLISELDRESTD